MIMMMVMMMMKVNRNDKNDIKFCSIKRRKANLNITKISKKKHT